MGPTGIRSRVSDRFAFVSFKDAKAGDEDIFLFECEDRLSELFLAATNFCKEAERSHEVVPTLANS